MSLKPLDIGRFGNHFLMEQMLISDSLYSTSPEAAFIFLDSAVHAALENKSLSFLTKIYKEKTRGLVLGITDPNKTLEIAATYGNILLLRCLLNDYKDQLDKKNIYAALFHFARFGNVCAMDVVLEGSKGLFNQEHMNTVFRNADPVAISYLLDTANRINIERGTIWFRLTDAVYLGQKEELCIQAIFSAPGIQNLIGNNMWNFLWGNRATYRFLDANLQNFDFQFFTFEPSYRPYPTRIIPEVVLNKARELHCFNIIRKMLEHPAIISANNKMRGVLEQCLETCNEAQELGLAKQISHILS